LTRNVQRIQPVTNDCSPAGQRPAKRTANHPMISTAKAARLTKYSTTSCGITKMTRNATVTRRRRAGRALYRTAG